MNGNQSSGGISFLGALALIFIALKLTGTIDWSWWWVLAPIWVPGILTFVGLGGLAVLLVLDRPRGSQGTGTIIDEADGKGPGVRLREPQR